MVLVYFISPSIANVWRQSLGKNQLAHIYDVSLNEWKIVIMAVENVLTRCITKVKTKLEAKCYKLIDGKMTTGSS